MKFAFKSLGFLWRFLARFLWCVLGAWTALATFFSLPIPLWAASAIAIAIGLVFLLALRERLVKDRKLQPWRAQRISLVAMGISVLVAALFFTLVRPDPNLNWAADHAHHPQVTFSGDIVTVKNFRNFTWRTSTDFDPKWEERTYDLSTITSMYYVVVPIRQIAGVAHVFVCFGFSDGQHVALSVEGRRVVGRPYRVIQSMFRQYQIIYVIGDERDVVGLRGAVWKNEVRFWPAATSPDRVRAIFVSMLEQAHSLEKNPEFYHLLVNNCMTNITRHLRALGGHSLPYDFWLLLTGLSDRAAFRLGYFDTHLPFEEARRAFTVDDWMRTTPLDEGFAQRLRDLLRERGGHVEGPFVPDAPPAP